MAPIIVAVAWLVGCAIGLLIEGEYSWGIDSSYGTLLLWLGALQVGPLLLARGNRRAWIACLILMSAIAGCGRALLEHPTVSAGDLAYYNRLPGSSSMVVEGTISAEPVLQDRTQRIRVSATRLLRAGSKVPLHVAGDLYAILPRYPAYNASERVSLVGVLTSPPTIGAFDYAAYLARQKVYSYMSYPAARSLGHSGDKGLVAWVLSTRPSVRSAIERSMPEPQAALTVGVVTGDRSSIPSDVQEAFRRSGTSHILAISGENIALLVGVVWLFYRGRSSRRRMPVLLLLFVLANVVAYTIFTGSTASVVRSAIMAGVLLLAPLLGRRYDPIAALSTSAVLMTLFDPFTLADAGFQLSFLSMFGIALVSPHLYALARRFHVPAALGLPLATGLGAQAATAPLIALLYGQVSIVSPFATLVADIALLPLMISGIATGLAGALLPATQIGALLGLLVWPFASWMLFWVELWARPSWASVDIGAAGLHLVPLYYVLLGALLWLLRGNTRARVMGMMRSRLAVTAVGAATCAWVVLMALILSSG